MARRAGRGGNRRARAGTAAQRVAPRLCAASQARPTDAVPMQKNNLYCYINSALFDIHVLEQARLQINGTALLLPKGLQNLLCLVISPQNVCIMNLQSRLIAPVSPLHTPAVKHRLCVLRVEQVPTAFTADYLFAKFVCSPLCCIVKPGEGVQGHIK
jgi:hypothetical protein